MIDAINEWGTLKGIMLGIKRIAKCHPLGSKGFDPIPKISILKNNYATIHEIIIISKSSSY